MTDEARRYERAASVPEEAAGTINALVILREDLPFEQWEALGKDLIYTANRIMWRIGDWWRFGEHRYGERAQLAADWAHEGGLSFGTLMNAGVVSRAFETSRRREVLSWSHHTSVASLPEDQQDRLLDRAIENKWSTRDLRKAVRRIKWEGNEYENRPLPEGKYRVIYADPPWSYSNELPAMITAPEDFYPQMTLEEILDLPVPSLADDDCVLFLWATVPLIREALQVVEAWGFEYKTHFVWDKVKHNMGHYSSVRHELLLVCVKGSCTPDAQKLHDSVVALARTEHSRKPEYFREIIDGLYTVGARIELFSRRAVPGWEAWGNEFLADRIQPPATGQAAGGVSS